MQLEPIRFYEENYASYWQLSLSDNDQFPEIEVYVEGDEESPNEAWLAFAYDVFDNWMKIMDLAVNRLRLWAEYTDNNYEVVRIYVGDYPYGPQASVQHGFKLTCKTIGNESEDQYGEFTVNFNKNMWPIGYEFSIA